MWSERQSTAPKPMRLSSRSCFRMETSPAAGMVNSITYWSTLILFNVFITGSYPPSHTQPLFQVFSRH